MQKPNKANQRYKNLISRPLLAGAAAAGFALAGGAAQGAIFLKTTPAIAGEVTAVGHVGEIELNSIQEGWGRTTKYGNIGIQLGKVACSGITVTKSLDKASLPLLDVLIKGSTLSKATFSLTRTNPSGDPVTYYTVTLNNAVIDGISLSSGGDRPSESLSFIPLTIDLSYYPDGAGAKGPAPLTSSIDCKQ